MEKHQQRSSYPKRSGSLTSRNTANSPKRKMILTSTSIHEKKNTTFNDCEIIVMDNNPNLQIYSKRIKYDLFKKFWLSVGLIFQADQNVDVEALITRLKLCGTIFVIILKPENETFESMDLLIVNGLSRDQEHHQVPKHLAHTLISIVSDGFIKESERRPLFPGEIPKYEISLKRLVEQWMKNPRPNMLVTLNVQLVEQRVNTRQSSNINIGTAGLSQSHGRGRAVKEIVPLSNNTAHCNVIQVQQHNLRSKGSTSTTMPIENPATENAVPSSPKSKFEDAVLVKSNKAAVKTEAACSKVTATAAIPDTSESTHNNNNNNEEDQEQIATTSETSSELPESDDNDNQFFSGLSEEYETAEEELLEEGELTEEEDRQVLTADEATEEERMIEEHSLQEHEIIPCLCPDEKKIDNIESDTIRVTTLPNSGKRIVICNSKEFQTGNRARKIQEQKRPFSPLPTKKQHLEPVKRQVSFVTSRRRSRDRRRARERRMRNQRNIPAQQAESYQAVPSFPYQESNSSASGSFIDEHIYEEDEMINIVQLAIPTTQTNQENSAEETFQRIPVHSRLMTNNGNSKPRIPVHQRLGKSFPVHGRSFHGEDKRSRGGGCEPIPVHVRLGRGDRQLPVSSRLGTTSTRRTPVKDRLG